MRFNEFVEKNKNTDLERDYYTRYLLDYNKKLDMPILVKLTTDCKGYLNISVHETNLPSSLVTDYKDKEYVRELTSRLVSGCGFSVDEKPMTELESGSCGDYAVIDHVFTQDIFCRKGLGSYCLQLAQDYYKRTNHITYGDNKYKEIHASKWGYNPDGIYANKVDRHLGVFGRLLAHAKAKILNNKNSELAYISFLVKNNFSVDKHPYQIPYKPIVKDRNIISDTLLDENNKRGLVQAFDTIVSIEDMVKSAE